MRRYERPELKQEPVGLGGMVASLNDWLASNELTGAGITTYIVQS